jgi:hypothetical protein
MDHTDPVCRRRSIDLTVSAADDALAAFGRRLYGLAWVCVSQRGSAANDTAAAAELVKGLLHWCDDRGLVIDGILEMAAAGFLEEMERPRHGRPETAGVTPAPAIEQNTEALFAHRRERHDGSRFERAR